LYDPSTAKRATTYSWINADILVDFVRMYKETQPRSSPAQSVLRIHDFFRGSTTAMVVRALKRALSHTEDVAA